MINIEDFDTFNHIENKELRTWNRCAMVFNVGKDHGPKVMQEYAAQLTADDRKDMSEMFERIQNDGYEFTRATVMRNNQPHAIN